MRAMMHLLSVTRAAHSSIVERRIRLSARLMPISCAVPDISTLRDHLAAPLPALAAGEMLHGLAVRDLL